MGHVWAGRLAYLLALLVIVCVVGFAFVRQAIS